MMRWMKSEKIKGLDLTQICVQICVQTDRTSFQLNTLHLQVSACLVEQTEIV